MAARRRCRILFGVGGRGRRPGNPPTPGSGVWGGMRSPSRAETVRKQRLLETDTGRGGRRGHGGPQAAAPWWSSGLPKSLNSLRKRLILASGSAPRSVLAPPRVRGGPPSRFRGPERIVFESKTGLERVQPASKSIATTSIVFKKRDHHEHEDEK